MIRYTFPTGLDAALSTFPGGDWLWLLMLDTWAPDPTTEEFVADVVAYELTDGTYARQALSSPTRTATPPTSPNGVTYVTLDADDPDFGTVSGGEVAGWLVLAQDVTNDADSPLVLAFPVDTTTDGSDVTYVLSQRGFLQVASQCPADF